MIPLQVTFIVFIILSILKSSRTLFILAIFSWINIYIDTFTTPDDEYLMLMYSLIDFACGVTVFYFGDIQKTYQTVILSLMIFTHCVMEIMLIQDYVPIIESNIYINTITTLLLLQMIGGFYAQTTLPLYQSDSNSSPTWISNLLNHQSNNVINEDKK